MNIFDVLRDGQCPFYCCLVLRFVLAWLKKPPFNSFFPKLFILCVFSASLHFSTRLEHCDWKMQSWMGWADHLALCSVPCSTLRAMGIPTRWRCLKRFWDRSIPWFTETLNTMFGSGPNGVSNRTLQSCSFCSSVRWSPPEELMQVAVWV